MTTSQEKKTSKRYFADKAESEFPNSRRKLSTGQMFESRGMRLVMESVGNKSAKWYISQKITNRWHCRAKQRFIELLRTKQGQWRFIWKRIMATMKVRLFLLSSLNATICIKSSLRQMFYGIYKPSDIMNISLTPSQ